MVNFRYHLVSLIAVFLALAVGVVLGAGPLQNAIVKGPGAESEAASLQRTQAELADVEELTSQYATFTDAVGGEVLADTLDGHAVAFVLLPGASTEDVDLLADALESAGGEVLGRVLLTDDWETTDANSYRETLAGPVGSHLEGEPKDTSAVGVLALALVEALTVDGSEADLLREMLTDEETPLVSKTSMPSERVTDLVLVGPPAAPDADDAQSGGVTDPARDRAWIALGSALAQAGGANVAVGEAHQPGQFISVLRSGGVRLGTVDQVGTPMAGLNVTAVLASGSDGAFGQGEGASSPVAPLP